MNTNLWKLLCCVTLFTGCTGTGNSTPSEMAELETLSHVAANVPTQALEPATNAIELSESISRTRRTVITDVVASCSPAVVGINVTEERITKRRPSMYESFYGRYLSDPYRKHEVKSLGSGFIISADGYILTNEHVAGDATKIVVTMTDGSRHNAKLIGADPISDVAVLKIEGTNLPHLEFADSRDVIPGEWTVAFGNPFGLFDINAKPTITVGVVSNTDVAFMQEGKVYRDMIQTDAAISSGNSGGPLVNAEGKVIGMNATIFSTAQSMSGAGSIGIGFAIPSNRIWNIIRHIKQHGEIDRNTFFGVAVRDVDDLTKAGYSIKDEYGPIVVEVLRGSPADKAGLRPGDKIISVDGDNVMRSQNVELILADAVVGETLEVIYSRNGTQQKTEITAQAARQRRR